MFGIKLYFLQSDFQSNVSEKLGTESTVCVSFVFLHKPPWGKREKELTNADHLIAPDHGNCERGDYRDKRPVI